MIRIWFLIYVIETIAEHLRRPLYVVSGGELGVTPDSAEKKLSRVMEIATVWKAVVLIDEADIFLQKRDLENLGRNSLVASTQTTPTPLPGSGLGLN